MSVIRPPFQATHTFDSIVLPIATTTLHSNFQHVHQTSLDMTDPLEGFGDASPVTPPTASRVSTFVLLPEDILVEILLLLDARHILSLRQVSLPLAL